MGPQLRGGEQLRKMQAQNSSEGKESKKCRQYSAPPTGPKTGLLSVAKEFIDFLLDHDASRLRPLNAREIMPFRLMLPRLEGVRKKIQLMLRPRLARHENRRPQ